MDQTYNIYEKLVKGTDYIMKTKNKVVNFIKNQINMPNMLPAVLDLII